MTSFCLLKNSVAILLLLTGSMQASSEQAAAPQVAPDFHADVAPILRDYCVGCHNQEELDGDLSVETFADLMRGGESGPSIQAGSAAGSFFIRTVTKEEKPRMPPSREPQPTEEEVAVLQAWVDAGAKGPPKTKDLSILNQLVVPEVDRSAEVKIPVHAVASSPDGRTTVVARYDEVEVWRKGGEKPLRILKGAEGRIKSLQFSSDGSRLVAASGLPGLRGVATVWQLESGEVESTFGDGSRDIFFDALFSPDERLIAAGGYDRVVRIWDRRTGERLHEIDVHNGAIFDLAFSPDGKVLASASGDQTVKLWRVADGERLDTLNQPEGEQYAVTFSRDGRFILAAGGDNRIRLWRFVSRDQPRINPLVRALLAHEAEITRLAVSDDGQQLFSASADQTIKVWGMPGLDPVQTLPGQSDLVSGLGVVREGVLVGRMDGSWETLPLKSATSGGEKQDSEVKPAAVPPRTGEITTVDEVEPNQGLAQAMPLELPATVMGRIDEPNDVDLFRIRARAGERLAFDVNAARMKSPLDSRIEVLHADGRPVVKVRLQAVRDSWFTFRGKTSDVFNDFRIHNWMEMELNDYLYANGEVVKLFLYPRGADSGFNVYPGFGKRHAYFGTTALSHALGEPCYIVRPLGPDEEAAANGLPVFTLHYENDDESKRRWGKDSQVLFTAPEDGEYLLRLRDVTLRGGEEFHYQLTARSQQPGFVVKPAATKLKVSPGSGRELRFTTERLDDFNGAIEIGMDGLPPGFHSSGPITVEEGQYAASLGIYADADAVAPTEDQVKAIQIWAQAEVEGEPRRVEVGGLAEFGLAAAPKVRLEIVADGESGQPKRSKDGPLELTLVPGETISAVVKIDRAEGFNERVPFGKDDAGRNLPFGVFVDNIGLNGLLITEGKNERQFFITAGPTFLPNTTRKFHLRTTADGEQISPPVLLHLRRPDPVASR